MDKFKLFARIITLIYFLLHLTLIIIFIIEGEWQRVLDYILIPAATVSAFIWWFLED